MSLNHSPRRLRSILVATGRVGPVAHWLPAACLPTAADCRLPTADCRLPTADCCCGHCDWCHCCTAADSSFADSFTRRFVDDVEEWSKDHCACRVAHVSCRGTHEYKRVSAFPSHETYASSKDHHSAASSFSCIGIQRSSRSTSVRLIAQHGSPPPAPICTKSLNARHLCTYFSIYISRDRPQRTQNPISTS